MMHTGSTEERQGRVLIVDDEAELAAALAEMLSKQGYETKGLADGQQALAVLAGENFDVLLADLMMPAMDGVSLLRAALDIDPDLIGIIMTGQGTVQTAVDAMRQGAFDYLLKPFKLSTVLASLERSLEVRRLRAENVQLRELLGIYELGQAVAYKLDVDEIFKMTANAAIQLFQAEEASILVPIPGEDGLVLAWVAGIGREHLIGARVPGSGTIAGWVAAQREMLILEGEVNDPRFLPAHPRPDIRYAICMPMVAADAPVGVINVNLTRRRPVSPGQVRALSILAGLAAAAIHSARLFDSLQRSNQQLTRAYNATIEGWSHALDLRDHETEGHTQRVTEMTLRLAAALGGFDEEDLTNIRRGALLHDIGKMGIPDKILLKAGQLTEAEQRQMRKHPEYAYQLLYPIGYLRKALDIPYCHHELWDGTGYPRGLKGRAIPRQARIFTVVDVWDALRSDRPYRHSLTVDEVIAYIREQSGKHFDPEVVDAFIKLVGATDGVSAGSERAPGLL